MKISQRILYLIVGMLALLMIVGNVVISGFVKNYLANEEQEQMEAVTQTVGTHIMTRGENYLSSVNDWSHWDDTYDYVNSQKEDFVAANFYESTFTTLNINLVMIVDKSNNVAKDELYFNGESGEFAEFPKGLSEKIMDHIEADSFKGNHTLLVQIQNQCFLLAFGEITDSQEEKPANGVLVFGRLLDGAIIGVMEDEIGGKIQLLENPPANFENARSNLSEGDYQYIGLPDASGKVMENFMVLQKGTTTAPEVVARIEKQRSFYTGSLSKFTLLQVIYSVLILLVSFLFYFFLRKYVSAPISKITDAVSQMGISDGNVMALPMKIDDQRKDEFAVLSIAINTLVDSISNAQKSLRQSEEEFRIMFAEAPLGIGLFDFKTGKALNINRKFSEIIGQSHIDSLNINWQDITHPDDMAENQKFREQIFVGEIKGFNMLKRYFKSDGTVIWVNLIIVLLDPLTMENPRELCMIEDVTDRKNREEEITFLSNHDVLTGVFNRRFFEEEKKRLDTSRQLPLSIIIGDLDGLKLVNDGFGYASGDKLLQESAKILKHCCRAEEIICRIGGDEFCILLPKETAAAAKTIVKRIHELCENTQIQLSNAIIRPSISLGYATKTNENEKMEEIIAIAEDSMRKSKLLSRKSVRSDLISSIQATMLEKSHETAEHAERMAILSLAVGEALGLSDDKLYEVELAAKLHDIGKMSIDHHILSKRGKLTEAEWIKIKKHPEIGYRIAQSTSELISISDYILAHHERWDGKGYPQGLKETEIPLIARIITIVDSYDAMTENRPYRKAINKDEAMAEIIKNAGSQFDPQIAKLFVEILKKNPKYK